MQVTILRSPSNTALPSLDTRHRFVAKSVSCLQVGDHTLETDDQAQENGHPLWFFSSLDMKFLCCDVGGMRVQGTSERQFCINLELGNVERKYEKARY